MTDETPTPAIMVTDLKLFEATPGMRFVFLPDSPRFTIAAASDDICRHFNVPREQFIGRGVFEAFPANSAEPTDTGEKEMRASLAFVLKHKKPHQLATQRYDIQEGDGSYTTRYWKADNYPVCDEHGEVEYIIHTTEDITHNITAEQSNERARDMEKANSLFMNAPVIVGILKGDDYIIELANEGLLEVWGRTKDVIGQPLLSAIPELEEQGLLTLLDTVRETGEPFYAYEFPILLNRHGKDELVYFNFVYKPIYDDGATSKASGLFSVGYDVTAQVVARRAVQESEEKYRSLFESMDQGFCVVEIIFDADGVARDYRFVEINPVFEKQSGLRDAVGKTALELVPNLEYRWIEMYGTIATTGEPTRFVEGSEAMGKWFDVYAFKVGDSSSRKVALLFSDITERKKAEEATRANEQRLRNIILQAPIAMCILRGDNFIIDVANKKMFELWGISPEGVLNTPLFDAVPEARNEGFEELLTNVLRTGEPFTGRELPVSLPRNGKVETVFINVSYEPIRETDGAVSAVMVMVTDATEQVLARQKIEDLVAQRTQELERAYDALVFSNQELARSNSNLEEFAYAASHDLKEPMRKIHIFSDRLKSRLQDKLEEEDEKFFERIFHATERMTTLIDDLLLYSHVSRGAVLEEHVDLNQKVSAVLDDLDVEIEEKNATVTVHSLPVIKGHRRQLQQLFQNLIGNALKYTKTNLAPQIVISSRLANTRDDLMHLTKEKGTKPYHLIEVADNGIGFLPEDAERIFNVFTRLHGIGEFKGTGVGLSIVRKVAENHGGHVWAEGKPGEGATFKILFPAE